MNQSVTERLNSGTSTAATDGGAKRPGTRRVVRQVLVDVGTCIYCEARKAEFTATIGHGHHREQVNLCGVCFKQVPLEKIAARVFGKREGDVGGCRFHGQPEYDLAEVAHREGVGA